MKKFIFTAISLFMIHVIAGAQNRTADEKAIQAIIDHMEKGWNTKSGSEFATGFSEDHDYIVWNGWYFRNLDRKKTDMNHQQLFDGPYSQLNLKLKTDKIRFIREDIAVVHVLGASYPAGQPLPADPSVLISLVVEKKKEGWKIISFHNSDLEAFQDKEKAGRSPMPLELMYAAWYKK